jgi:hypothetical protein
MAVPRPEIPAPIMMTGLFGMALMMMGVRSRFGRGVIFGGICMQESGLKYCMYYMSHFHGARLAGGSERHPTTAFGPSVTSQHPVMSIKIWFNGGFIYHMSDLRMLESDSMTKRNDGDI